MKRLLAVFSMLFGLAMVSYAGTPQETFFQNQFPFSNTTIWGSTASVTSAVSLTKTVAAPTCANGASGRNCFTNFIVQIPSTTVLTILDGATTNYTIYGSAMGTTGSATLQFNREHLGPLCSSVGNSTMFNLTGTGGVSTNAESFNYEGYTNCGGSNNAGQ